MYWVIAGRKLEAPRRADPVPDVVAGLFQVPADSFVSPSLRWLCFTRLFPAAIWIQRSEIIELNDKTRQQSFHQETFAQLRLDATHVQSLDRCTNGCRRINIYCGYRCRIVGYPRNIEKSYLRVNSAISATAPAFFQIFYYHRD